MEAGTVAPAGDEQILLAVYKWLRGLRNPPDIQITYTYTCVRTSGPRFFFSPLFALALLAWCTVKSKMGLFARRQVLGSSVLIRRAKALLFVCFSLYLFPGSLLILKMGK